MTVWVLNIEYKHGVIRCAYSSRRKAQQALDDYVKEYWDDCGPGNWGDIEMPKRREDRIELYFQDNDQEWADIMPLKVDP